MLHENSEAYRLLDVDSNVIIESRYVEFLESNFFGDTNINPRSNTEGSNSTLTQDVNSNSSSFLNNERK